jgi:hypothetical protein
VNEEWQLFQQECTPEGMLVEAVCVRHQRMDPHIAQSDTSEMSGKIGAHRKIMDGLRSRRSRLKVLLQLFRRHPHKSGANSSFASSDLQHGIRSISSRSNAEARRRCIVAPKWGVLERLAREI